MSGGSTQVPPHYSFGKGGSAGHLDHLLSAVPTSKNGIWWLTPSGAELHVRVGGHGPQKFLNFFLYYIEIFNILIISPQKWDLAPSTFELVQ